MRQKVLIRYSWNGRDEERWLFWLEKKVQALGCEVSLEPFTPPRPMSSQKVFVENLQEAYGIDEAHTHLVHHDPGCLTILKYLEYLVRHQSRDSVMLVAGTTHTVAMPLAPTTITDIKLPDTFKGVTKQFEPKLVILFSTDIDALPEERKKLQASHKKFSLPH